MIPKWFRMGGGLQLKEAADAIPDDGLRTADFCAFDEVGTVTSARGRVKLNNELTVGETEGGGSVLGGVDGILNEARRRFIKRGGDVWEGIVYDTGVPPQTPLLSEYDQVLDDLPPIFTGGDAPEWNMDAILSGFVHNGYAYLADGTGMCRVNITEGDPETITTETWGLVAPGYHTFDGDRADPLATEVSDTTVIVTVAGGHGLDAGMGSDFEEEMEMVIELVGMEVAGTGLKSNDVNCIHSGYDSTTDGNVLVTSSGGTMDPATDAATYTIEWVGDWSNTGLPPIRIISANAGFENLGGSLHIANDTVQDGSTTQNEIQSIHMTGTGDSGYFRIDVSDHFGTSQQTGNLAWDCTASDVQDALQALPMFAGNTQRVTTACTILDDETFSFQVPDGTSVTTVEGFGGKAGFMRQGPSLSISEDQTGDLIAGTYRYAYTFFNGVAESNFSVQVPLDVPADAAIQLDNVLEGPAGTTERRIYRTDVNARQLYYVGRIPDNTTHTFTDVAGRPLGADAETSQGSDVTDQERLGSGGDVIGQGRRAQKRGIKERESAAKAASAKKRERLSTNLGLLSDWTDHDPPPLGIRDAGMIGETCFAIAPSVTDDNGEDVIFSASDNVEHFPLSNRFRPGRNTSATLQTWRQFDREVIVYTDNSLHRFTALGLDFSDARLEEIESPMGLAGKYAVASLDGLQGHVFLTTAGIYLFDGARVQCVSDAIEPMFTDPADADYFTPAFMDQAIMTMSRDRMLLSYRSSAVNVTGANNRLLWGDFSDPSNPRFSVYEWDLTSLWREKASNDVLSGDDSGYVYLNDYLWADTAATDWNVQTKEYPLADGMAFALDELLLDADFAGATTTITVATRLRGHTKSTTFTASTTGRQRTKLKLPPYFKGEVAQVRVASTSLNKRALYAVGWTFRPLGVPESEP
jgi:hypothetical protein